eukprot:jgi/Hompol1/1092/HPOL_005509-RA
MSVAALIESVRAALASQPSEQPQEAMHRVLVSVAGVPGAGKTTFAAALPALLAAAGVVDSIDHVAVLPMDGFHLPRSSLDALDDPINAHRRRGAPFTFDPLALVTLLHQIKASLSSSQILAPAFDHAHGDPVQGAISIQPLHKVVIIEGLYLHLADQPWCQIHAAMDVTCFISIPLGIAAERLAARHVACGLASTIEQAMERVLENDMLNAQYILAHSLPAAITIPFTDLLESSH